MMTRSNFREFFLKMSISLPKTAPEIPLGAENYLMTTIFQSQLERDRFALKMAGGNATGSPYARADQ